MKTTTQRFLASMGLALSLAGGSSTVLADGFTLGDAANYAVLFEGGGGNHLNINNGPALNGLAVNGNIGIDNTGILQLSGPLVLNSDVHFANAVNDNGPYGGNIVVNGTISGGHANVHTDLLNLNSLSSSLGAEAGTSISLTSGGVINGAAGVLDASGNRVFSVSSVNLPNGVLTINGDGTHKVVINIGFSANIHANSIVLGGGLTSDDVLFNIFGGANLTGGPTLDLNSNFSGVNGHLAGTFLDPNGTISMVNSVLDGRLFGGDSHDMQIVSGAEINSPPGVPDAGSTLAMLSLGLGFLGVVRRKLSN